MRPDAHWSEAERDLYQQMLSQEDEPPYRPEQAAEWALMVIGICLLVAMIILVCLMLRW